MLFAPRAATKPMTEFLRRLAISLEAGIDVRKALGNEARRSAPGLRERIEAMSTAINGGSTLTTAIDETGNYFPVLVRELISVGEQTGHLPEVLRQLVAHYDEQMALRRTFLSTIAWPLVQLGMALAVIGFLIWMSAVITRMTGSPTDMLGIGLTGEVGLAIYVVIISAISFGLYMLYRAVMAGTLWAAPVQRLVLKLPVLGPTLRNLSVARFAWTLHLTMGAAIDVKRALALSLASTHNVEFMDQGPYIDEMITRGESIHETLLESHVFPIELIQAVQVGEESGRLVETLAVLAQQQLDAARRAFVVLTKVAGYVVWAMIATLIIIVIFRLFGSYVGQINGMLKSLK